MDDRQLTLSTDLVMADYLTHKASLMHPDRKELWPSDMGMDPAKAMNRIVNKHKVTFPREVLAKMDVGVALESATANALAYLGGVTRDVYLFHGPWVGKADFIFNHGLSHKPLIIEHKGVSDNYFDYRGTWPKSTHVCQLWLYGWLYERMFGVKPGLQLFYRSHNHVAVFEFDYELPPVDSPIEFYGRIDYDKEVLREGYYNPNWLRLELEYWFSEGVVPQAHEGKNDWSYPEESYSKLRAIYEGE